MTTPLTVVDARAGAVRLRVAWETGTGGQVAELTMRHMLHDGWTVADVTRLVGLGRAAVAADTGVARLATMDVGPTTRSVVEATCSRLATLMSALLGFGSLSLGEAFGWLTAAAGAPEIAAVYAVEQMAYGTIGEGATMPVNQWPAGVGPWAWAAGLSLAEARTRSAGQTGDGLRALAALRGHRVFTEASDA